MTESSGVEISTAASVLVLAVIALVVVVVVIASTYLGETDEQARRDVEARRRLLDELQRHNR